MITRSSCLICLIKSFKKRGQLVLTRIRKTLLRLGSPDSKLTIRKMISFLRKTKTFTAMSNSVILMSHCCSIKARLTLRHMQTGLVDQQLNRDLRKLIGRITLMLGWKLVSSSFWVLIWLSCLRSSIRMIFSFRILRSWTRNLWHLRRIIFSTYTESRNMSSTSRMLSTKSTKLTK